MMGNPEEKNLPPPASTYRPACHVSWAVETAGVLVIDRAAESALPIGYPQAAVWDLASRGHRPEQIAAMLRRIGSLDPAAARRLVEESLQTWVDEGLFVESRDHD